MPGSRTLDLRIPSELQHIEGVVDAVLRACADGSVDARALGFKLPVALTEALSNAILRGNGEDAGKEVHVRVEVLDDAIVVEVEDEGQGFDFEACVGDPTAPENLEREDGRGLFLMRALVDRVENFRIGRTPPGPQAHVVRLTLHRPGHAA